MPAQERAKNGSEGADTSRPFCLPTEIYTDVVKAKIVRDGSLLRKIRVAKKVREVEFCAAEVVRARVEVGESAWEVTVLFRIVVGFDPSGSDRVVRTIAFYKTRIPFPLTTSTSTSTPTHTSGSRRPIHFRKLEARVKIADLDCDATVGADQRVIAAELTFKVVLLLLEDEFITVCRLRPHEDE